MSAPQDVVAAWLSEEGPLPPLDLLAAYALADGIDEREIEERIGADLEAAIRAATVAAAGFDAPVRSFHRFPAPPPLPVQWRGVPLAQLQVERERLREAWRAAVGAAAYRDDKLHELDAAPDAVTAADAVTRWNLLGKSPATPLQPLPYVEAPPRTPAVPPAELHAAVLRHVVEFFTRADDPESPPPRVLLTAGTGSRKTGTTLAHLRTMIADRKAAGKPHRAVMLVPAHRLGREAEERARAAGINASLFLGRGDINKPDQPCRNLEAVGLARQAGCADVRGTVCGPAPGGGRCAYRDSCGYFAGLDRARAADLVIAAHTFLFEALPKELRNDVAWVIVDEDFAGLADRVFDLPLHLLAPESLAHFPVLAEGEPDPDATAELGRLYAQVTEAARACSDGYLTAEALRAAGFTAMSGAAARMRTLSWARKRDPQMRPGMDLEARKSAVRLAAINAQLGGIAALAHALDAILSNKPAEAGRVSVRFDVRGGTILTVRGQREPATWLADTPVLMLNATGRLADVKRAFPNAELAEAPPGATPWCEFRQVIGGFGRSTLTRHPKRLAELRDFMNVASLGVDGGALVVTHKAIEHHFAGMPGIATAHHGDIAGLDAHADTPAAFIIGGAFPGPEEVASIAAARGGGAVVAAKPAPVTRAALLTGAAVAISAMAYEDPAADAVHRGIYDASIIQAAGRVRPLERTADNPAIVWVFANVSLPFPVTSVDRWRDIKPDRLVRMVVGEAVWANAADMARFRPDLFSTAKAGEHARRRFAGTVADMREAVAAIVRNDRRAWVEITYQPPGSGQRRRPVWCPAGAEAAVRSAVEAEVGEPVSWQVERLTPGREDTPTSGISISYPGMGESSPEDWPDLAGQVPDDGGEWVRGPPDG